MEKGGFLSRTLYMYDVYLLIILQAPVKSPAAAFRDDRVKTGSLVESLVSLNRGITPGARRVPRD